MESNAHVDKSVGSDGCMGKRFGLGIAGNRMASDGIK